MDDKKEKYAFWLRPSLVAEMEEMIVDEDIRSKSEFVTHAIKFYIGYLRQDKNTNYLAPIIAQTVKEEGESLETNLSRMLFKLAVEIGMNTHLTAHLNHIPDKSINALRNMCSNEVAQNNGIIHFEEAYDYQHSEES
ncbi:MAG: hypothetical protein IJB02_02980 [Oscillospiraceae bacterium]|nr:hypothetical protein [Oscillospiraceae bacterium]